MLTELVFICTRNENPQTEVSNPFTDISDKDWFYKNVIFVYGRSLLTGTTATTFAPDAPITRQEMAVMLVNYSKAVGNTLGTVRAEAPFADSKSIASWANSAVKQVQVAEIITGRNGNLFAPTAYATRAETSAILYRYIQRMSNSLSANGMDKNDIGK